MLRRITYLSTATRFFDFTDQEDLEAVAEECRRNNVAADVTGILLFVDGSFLQVIEGEDRVIESLMRSLERDVRHDRILVVENKIVADRLFPEWSMEVRKSRYSTVDATTGETFREVIARISKAEGEGLLTVFLDTFFSSADRLVPR